jgi:hypothetical protein
MPQVGCLSRETWLAWLGPGLWGVEPVLRQAAELQDL